jgi:hypothetical protein
MSPAAAGGAMIGKPARERADLARSRAEPLIKGLRGARRGLV